MKRLMAIAMLLLVATVGFSDTVARFGRWHVMEMEGTLLDEGFMMIGAWGEETGTLIGVRMDVPRVAITFDKYLGSPNQIHDRDVLFVTNLMDPYRMPRAWRSNTDVLMWEGDAAEIIILALMAAELAMVRTYTYTGSRADFMLEVDRENFVKAVNFVESR